VPDGPSELRLKAGEMVDLHDTIDADWWYGSCKQGEGYFPAAYVEREPL
jgi:hypothetical protein